MMRFSTKVLTSIVLIALLFEASMFLLVRKRESEARKINLELIAEAKALGLSVDRHLTDGTALMSRRARQRTRPEDPRKLATDLVEFSRSFGEDFDVTELSLEETKQIQELVKRMRAAGPDTWKGIVGEIVTASDGEEVLERISVVFYSLIEDGPREVLEIFAPFAGNLRGGDMMVTSALAEWYSRDSSGAFQWFSRQSDNHAVFANGSFKTDLVSSVASKDPAHAFRLIGDLQLPPHIDLLTGIASAASIPEQRVSALSAFRAYLPELEESERMTATAAFLSTMVFGDPDSAKLTSFETAGSWLDAANLTPDETLALVSSMPPGGSLRDTGKWIEWIAKSGIQANEAIDRIRILTNDWVENDYRSAGEWLSGAAEGPAKQAATSAYTETVFPHDRDAALKWLDTLPAGEIRTETARNLHAAWPRETAEDQAAAAAFAAKEGIR